MGREPAGTLPEAMVALSVMAVLGVQLWRGGAEAVALQRLQTAAQRVTAGLEEGRAAALREGRPCGLRLGSGGWEPPRSSGLSPCPGVGPGIGSGVDHPDASPQLSHNLPDPVRFSANGLVLDGGTVWLRSPHTSLVRCVVVSLPLGVTRVGRQGPLGCEPESAP
jgi:hypothetical protein